MKDSKMLEKLYAELNDSISENESKNNEGNFSVDNPKKPYHFFKE